MKLRESKQAYRYLVIQDKGDNLIFVIDGFMEKSKAEECANWNRHKEKIQIITIEKVEMVVKE